METITYAADHG